MVRPAFWASHMGQRPIFCIPFRHLDVLVVVDNNDEDSALQRVDDPVETRGSKW